MRWILTDMTIASRKPVVLVQLGCSSGTGVWRRGRGSGGVAGGLAIAGHDDPSANELGNPVTDKMTKPWGLRQVFYFLNRSEPFVRNSILRNSILAGHPVRESLLVFRSKPSRSRIEGGTPNRSAGAR